MRIVVPHPRPHAPAASAAWRASTPVERERRDPCHAARDGAARARHDPRVRFVDAPHLRRGAPGRFIARAMTARVSRTFSLRLWIRER